VDNDGADVVVAAVVVSVVTQDGRCVVGRGFADDVDDLLVIEDVVDTVAPNDDELVVGFQLELGNVWLAGHIRSTSNVSQRAGYRQVTHYTPFLGDKAAQQEDTFPLLWVTAFVVKAQSMGNALLTEDDTTCKLAVQRGLAEGPFSPRVTAISSVKLVV
jgi:hypothetical protein